MLYTKKLFTGVILQCHNKLECLSLPFTSPKSNICGQGQEPTIKVESHNYGRLQPCPQILDPSLLRYGNNDYSKKLYSTAPGA